MGIEKAVIGGRWFVPEEIWQAAQLRIEALEKAALKVIHHHDAGTLSGIPGDSQSIAQLKALLTNRACPPPRREPVQEIPGPRKESNMPECPLCKQPLQRVRRSPNSPLNEDQFDASKAGDWFCECSDNGRGNAPYAYFWTSELESGLLAH